jgi:hypothetical protein
MQSWLEKEQSLAAANQQAKLLAKHAGADTAPTAIMVEEISCAPQ